MRFITCWHGVFRSSNIKPFLWKVDCRETLRVFRLSTIFFFILGLVLQPCCEPPNGIVFPHPLIRYFQVDFYLGYRYNPSCYSL